MLCAVALSMAQAPASPTPPQHEESAPGTLEAPVLTPAHPPASTPPPAPVQETAPATAPDAAAPAATQDVPPPAAPKDATLEPPPAKKPQAAQADKTSPMPKAAVTEGADGKPYVIGSLDVLYIRVWNNGPLTGMVDVRPDGMISLALIGEVKVDGLTVPELTDTLKKRLGEFLVDPQLDVQVTKVNSKKYLVVGEVGRPGDYPLIGRTTIFEALTVAGMRDTANQKKIYLLRGSKRFPFNYKEVLQGKNLAQDIPVENGDRIVVPQ